MWEFSFSYLQPPVCFSSNVQLNSWNKGNLFLELISLFWSLQILRPTNVGIYTLILWNVFLMTLQVLVGQCSVKAISFSWLISWFPKIKVTLRPNKLLTVAVAYVGANLIDLCHLRTCALSSVRAYGQHHCWALLPLEWDMVTSLAKIIRAKLHKRSPLMWLFEELIAVNFFFHGPEKVH
jgi:hypothetical protein